MRIIEFLDVREREGKQPAFSQVATVYINDNGKFSLYVPLTGRFYPGKEKQMGGGQQQAPQHNAPPPQMPGHGGVPEPSPDHMPPLTDNDVPF